jgi:cephalosporin hydroxylase
MMMQGDKTKVVGVDISLDNYKKGGLKELMESYAADKGFELKLIQKSSISESTVSDVELLHIDSLHHPKHLMKELELHAPRVSKYILFHDTKVKNYELLKVVNKYIERHPKEWELVENYTGGKCGHAAIKRK